MQATPATQGINHLGLAVRALDQTVDFFVQCFGWRETGRDESYPRAAVSDGQLRLTLRQVDDSLDVQDFGRRRNIGLHHLALQVNSEDELLQLHDRLSTWPGGAIEFAPELLGGGPRKHMMCYEPGGIRVEFIWQGIR